MGQRNKANLVNWIHFIICSSYMLCIYHGCRDCRLLLRRVPSTRIPQPHARECMVLRNLSMIRLPRLQVTVETGDSEAEPLASCHGPSGDGSDIVKECFSAKMHLVDLANHLPISLNI